MYLVTQTDIPDNKKSDAGTSLWTDKYAPTTLKDIIGNKTNVANLSKWLSEWYVCDFGSS